MSFMVSDEFLLLLDPQPCWFSPPPYYLTLGDKELLREAGIQTAFLSGLDWLSVEPERGEYDFSQLEKTLEMNRAAGIKTLIEVPWRAPLWMPDEWLLQNIGGRVNTTGDHITQARYLSFWNEEAQEYCDNYLRMVVGSYQAPDVLFSYGEASSGEAVLPVEPFYYDPAAIADYKDRYGNDAFPDINTPETKEWLKISAIRRLIRVHKIINTQGEIWNRLQLLMSDWSESTVNWAQKDIMRAYQDAFPEVRLVVEQDTFYDDSHTDKHRDWVDSIKEEFQCDIIVEAMWPSGLPTTTPKAIASGYRGQIVGVSHSHIPDERDLSSTILSNIKESHKLWLESLQ